MIEEGSRRGHCDFCGYLGKLNADGCVGMHAVRRIDRYGKRYVSLAPGDETCPGALDFPVPLPEAKVKRMIVRRYADLRG